MRFMVSRYTSDKLLSYPGFIFVNSYCIGTYEVVLLSAFKYQKPLNGEIMNTFQKILAMTLMVFMGSSAQAHHSIAGEYGGADYPYNYLEGTVVDVAWINPHIAFTIETTSGYFGEGKLVRANSHPTHLMADNYGMDTTTVSVGDSVKVFGWEHLRGMPLFHIRALGVNDGPIHSTLYFADMYDLVRGNLDNNIIWAPNLEGSSPGRLGPEFTAQMQEAGLLNERGRVQLPEHLKVQ